MLVLLLLLLPLLLVLTFMDIPTCFLIFYLVYLIWKLKFTSHFSPQKTTTNKSVVDNLCFSLRCRLISPSWRDSWAWWMASLNTWNSHLLLVSKSTWNQWFGVYEVWTCKGEKHWYGSPSLLYMIGQLVILYGWPVSDMGRFVFNYAVTGDGNVSSCPILMNHWAMNLSLAILFFHFKNRIFFLVFFENCTYLQLAS